MKRIIIAFLILGFSECFSQDASNLPLTIKVIVDREYILTRHKSNYIFIQRLPCDSNYPIRITLHPGESKIYRGTLLKSIKFDYPGQQLFGQQVETTRLGLIVVGDIFADEKIDYFLEMEDKSKWKMVWSNALFLYGKQSENRFEK